MLSGNFLNGYDAKLLNHLMAIIGIACYPWQLRIRNLATIP
jgi:hypothetical protein